MQRAIALSALILLAGWAQAEIPAAFQGADLKLGERLMVEHKCNQCHAQKWGRDGLDIYRPKGRINSSSALMTMVEACNTDLGLGLFPEDVAAIAAVLNREHYHFSK
ncbi:hypothetical protein ACFOHU_08450 [Ottowia pentelensis]|uniref:Cytochrome c n=1 Tax=Ottowia pentelensis TaxID=511108 RepID=A0ABV6PSI5_9BURK|nr:hypothetical protein [Ottowia sp.]